MSQGVHSRHTYTSSSQHPTLTGLIWALRWVGIGKEAGNISFPDPGILRRSSFVSDGENMSKTKPALNEAELQDKNGETELQWHARAPGPGCTKRYPPWTFHVTRAHVFPSVSYRLSTFPHGNSKTPDKRPMNFFKPYVVEITWK